MSKALARYGDSGAHQVELLSLLIPRVNPFPSKCLFRNKIFSAKSIIFLDAEICPEMRAIAKLANIPKHLKSNNKNNKYSENIKSNKRVKKNKESDDKYCENIDSSKRAKQK